MGINGDGWGWGCGCGCGCTSRSRLWGCRCLCCMLLQDDAVVMQGGMSVVLLHFHCTIVLLSIAVVSVVSTGQDRSTEAVLSRVLAVLLLCCVLHCNCENVSQATGYVIYPAAVHHTPAYCRILGSALLCKFWSAATWQIRCISCIEKRCRYVYMWLSWGWGGQCTATRLPGWVNSRSHPWIHYVSSL